MIYVLLGQTASGKTSLALRLARRFRLPVLSADAYQCYRMMQIGTDKPRREDVADLDYRFYDCYDPDEEVNVSLFQKTYRPYVEEKVRNGEDLIVTGGTFLYIKALLFDYQFPAEDGEKDRFSGLSLSEQVEALRSLAPQVAEEIDLKNPRRVLRALLQAANGFDRDRLRSQPMDRPLYPSLFFQIKTDREEGNRRIDERVDRMFQEGFVSEVQSLLERYPSSLRSFQSLGYRELIEALRTGEDLEACKEKIKVHTHQYAKKQRTFLRHQFRDVHVLSGAEIEEAVARHQALRQRTDLLVADRKRKIESSSILLAGIGGVGGIVAEGLARLGVMDLSLLDKDIVDGTNLNRQLLYTLDDVGKRKVDVASLRLERINPLMKVLPLFQDAKEDLPRRYDVILDCIDDVDGKVALYRKAKKDGSLYLTSAGFGFHLDSTKVAYGFLKDVHDPLTTRFKKALQESGEEGIDSIPVVYPKDARRKSRCPNGTIGSVFPEVNAAGLALLTLLLKKWEVQEDE